MTEKSENQVEIHKIINKIIRQVELEERIIKCFSISDEIHNRYVMIDYISEGSAARILLVKNRLDYKNYIIKIYNKNEVKEKDKLHRVIMETDILQKVKHPLIINCKEIITDEKNIYIINDYYPSNLNSVIRKNKNIDEECIKFYAAELLCAIEYLHLLDYVHRDIKPENILIDELGHIKLADFDLSKKIDSENTECNISKIKIKKSIFGNLKFSMNEPTFSGHSFVGTVEYLAPEIIEEKQYDASVDWWEFGILLYEMKYGQTPFKGINIDNTMDKIIHLDLYFNSDIEISRELKDLIKKLLNKDYKKRLGFKHGSIEIKNHNFFKDINFQLIMNKNPNFEIIY